MSRTDSQTIMQRVALAMASVAMREQTDGVSIHGSAGKDLELFASCVIGPRERVEAFQEAFRELVAKHGMQTYLGQHEHERN